MKTYKIRQVVSKNKKSGGMMVIVDVNGLSVTRHLDRNYVGLNPDPTAIPEHTKADQLISQLQADSASSEKNLQRLHSVDRAKLLRDEITALDGQTKNAKDNLHAINQHLHEARAQKVHLNEVKPLKAYFE